MPWHPAQHTAHCPRCDITVGSQGHDPAGHPCSHCGTTLVARRCTHSPARYIELRARRSDPDTRRAQCPACDEVFVWRG